MFFQENYEPTFKCQFEQRIGRNGDGGKWVCDPHRIRQRTTAASACLIYSIGSNGEFSFEKQVKYILPHCEIHTFDSKRFACPINVCTIHKVRVGNGHNGTKSLQIIMTELNHTGRQIDILKVDIEGAEFSFFDDLFEASDGLSENLRQILFEIHLPKIMRPANKTKLIDYNVVHRLFRLFHDNHFVIFHKEANLYGPYTVFEYSMLRLNKTFFETTTLNSLTKSHKKTALQKTFTVSYRVRAQSHV